MKRSLIMVTGAGAGLGKSTLAAALHDSLAPNADLFLEEDMKTEPHFRDLWDEFIDTGRVRPATLIEAAARYLEAARRRGVRTLVLDSLFPYLPSLLAWGHSDEQIASFFGRLDAVFDGCDVIELHLVGDLRAGLQRAAGREGGDWLEWQIAKVAAFRGAGDIRTADDVVAHLSGSAERSRRLLERAPWRVVFLDADEGPGAVLAEAKASLTGGPP